MEKLPVCPICADLGIKGNLVEFYWTADRAFVADCPEHGMHIALITPLVIEE